MANQQDYDAIARQFGGIDYDAIAKAQTHTRSGGFGVPIESKEFKSGRALPEWAQRFLHIGDVVGMGLPKKFVSPEGEQRIRGAKKEFSENNPIESGVESFVGGVTPGVVSGGSMMLPMAAGRTAGPLVTAGRAVAQAVPEGMIQGVGASESRDPAELRRAAAIGGVFSGTMGAATSGGGQLGMGVVRNVAARTTERGAINDAQRELIKALSRDVPYGSVFDRAGSMSTPAGRGIARLNTLGPEARLVDVGGESVRRLADVLATLPGRAKQSFERAIHSRQAKRSERLMSAADEALGTNGRQYAPTLDALITERAAASGPLYRQLQGVQVQIDNDLYRLIARAGDEAMGKSQRLSRLAGDDQFALNKALMELQNSITDIPTPGRPIPFTSLDHVKQSLYDLESAYRRKGETGEAAGFANVRRELTAKLDQISPKDAAGQSIYAQARNAYAGPSQISDAVEMGRDALSEKSVELASLVSGLSGGEVDGFRIGALQALRELVGTEAGQTRLLKMWKEPATSDKLRIIFGNDYRQFSAAVAKERNLKAMESIGRGSDTAARAAGAEDLGSGLINETGETVAAAKVGDFAKLITGGANIFRRIRRPENTRNQLANLLLQRGNDAETMLRTLDQVTRNINRRRSAGAAVAGSVGASQQNMTD